MKLSSKLLLGLLAIFFGFMPITDPHIIGKIKWVMGGAIDMELLDWFDMFMHGIPLVLGLIVVVLEIRILLFSDNTEK